MLINNNAAPGIHRATQARSAISVALGLATWNSIVLISLPRISAFMVACPSDFFQAMAEGWRMDGG